MQSFEFLCVLLFLALPAASLKTSAALKNDVSLDFAEKPVMQIVRLLVDTKAELVAELKDDKEVHEMLKCWCIDNKKEKGKAIAIGKARKEKLESIISSMISKIAYLKTKRESTYQELQNDIKSLQEQRELRMKDNAEFRKQENDLIEAVKASGGAIVVLSEQHEPEPSLAQIRSATQKLMSLNAVQSAKGAIKQSASTLVSLLQGPHGAAFLESPGYQSYAPTSGQVFGILEQMKEDFQDSLKELQKEEAKAVAEFQDMKQAKDAEIALGENMVVRIEASSADALEKKAGAEKDYGTTVNQLNLDIEFMTNLKDKCTKDAETYDDRVKSRMEEIAAMEDAVEILNGADDFTVFDRMEKVAANDPLNPGLTFVQISSNRREDRARLRARLVLQEAAARSGSAHLVSLASKARIDAFTEVKAEIDKMVAELKTQMTDEVAFKDQCIADERMNAREQAAAKDAFEAASAKKAVLEKDIEELKEAMDEEETEMKETQISMKKTSENREADNAAVLSTVADHQMMSKIISKAIERLKVVYVDLLQQPGGAHTQTSASHTDPGNGPARFKTYQAATGRKIVGLLENVLKHTTDVEKAAMKEEDDDQTAYESFIKDSNKLLIAGQKALGNMQEKMAKMEESLSIANGDIDDSSSEIKRLIDSLAVLKSNCDYTVKEFDVRQKARQDEIDALGEAKAILSGAN